MPWNGSDKQRVTIQHIQTLFDPRTQSQTVQRCTYNHRNTMRSKTTIAHTIQLHTNRSTTTIAHTHPINIITIHDRNRTHHHANTMRSQTATTHANQTSTRRSNTRSHTPCRQTQGAQRLRPLNHTITRIRTLQNGRNAADRLCIS